MLEQLKKDLEAAKQSAANEIARLEQLLEKAKADWNYVRGHHDALALQLQKLGTDTPPAVAATSAAVTADSAAVAASGADLASDVTAVTTTEAAVSADAKLASDVAAVAAAATPAT